jgi:hypothetical protein
MIGDIFYHGVAPSEIKNMTWHEMTYWHSWVKVIENAKARAIDSRK